MVGGRGQKSWKIADVLNDWSPTWICIMRGPSVIGCLKCSRSTMELIKYQGKSFIFGDNLYCIWIKHFHHIVSLHFSKIGSHVLKRNEKASQFFKRTTTSWLRPFFLSSFSSFFCMNMNCLIFIPYSAFYEFLLLQVYL